MQDEKRMLEMAAKAVGAKVYWSTDGTLQDRPVLVTKCGGGMGTLPYEERWNPLTDDGLALRLAAMLRLSIDHNHSADQQRWVAVDRQGCEGCYEPVICVEDEFEDEGQRIAATRRAIVRAAAAIGEKMT